MCFISSLNFFILLSDADFTYTRTSAASSLLPVLYLTAFNLLKSSGMLLLFSAAIIFNGFFSSEFAQLHMFSSHLLTGIQYFLIIILIYPLY